MYSYRGSDWSTHDVDVRDFVQPVGPAVILPPTVLGLFCTSALVGTIVDQTNTYAHEILGDAAREKWNDVTS